MPRPACSASAGPQRTCLWNIAASSALVHCGRAILPDRPPATEQVATVRPYWSTEIGSQLTGRPAMKASRSFADFAPQRYCWLSSPRQSWVVSGASMPHRRMRVPWISSVSPSTMQACPVSWPSNAAPVDTREATMQRSSFARSSNDPILSRGLLGSKNKPLSIS